MKFKISLFILLFLASCESLETGNNNNPDRSAVLATGADLLAVLQGGYISWWRGVHSEHPNVALGVAADAYGMSWADFGARRMGEEPRLAYNNRITEEPDYRQIVEVPWFGCLSAVSTANDVFTALDDGISFDNGGPQDQSVRAAAHFLRGVSWGYLGLIFDRALLVVEDTDIQQSLSFSPYEEVIARAVEELDAARDLAQNIGIDFIHNFFNGIVLDSEGFVRLCNSYAARFLAQRPRTDTEVGAVDWQQVLAYAAAGISTDFAPLADGNQWTSYHDYVFAETGLPPFWARVDQRLISALDPNQPARYPEVLAQNEPELPQKDAVSADERLNTDFIFLPENNFPAERGEWHFSHYKHNRNIADPSFAGNGSTSGPMPAFIASDNQLLEAEAYFRLGNRAEAIAALNNGARVQRGNLPPLPRGSEDQEVIDAIFYERAIELFNAAPLGLWFDRRRSGPRLNFRDVDALGGLQTGTPAQLPVPATELRIQNVPVYSFGGPQDPEGINPF